MNKKYFTTLNWQSQYIENFTILTELQKKSRFPFFFLKNNIKIFIFQESWL